MEFYSFPKICQFNEIFSYSKDNKDIFNGNSSVGYQAKVKLHGTNCAIVKKDGVAYAQSRTKVITPEDDNFGFAKFVQTVDLSGVKDNIVIYGEWAGKTIQDNVACSKVDKFFAVFAIKDLNKEDSFIADPTEISNILESVKGIYVIPWYIVDLVNFEKESSVDEFTQRVNYHVDRVEKSDPFVKNTFGVDGVGEGLVYYPTSHRGLTNFINLGFKAKGREHSVVAAKPAQKTINLSTVNSFVETFVTEQRLMQGVGEINKNGFENKNIGSFVKWVSADVQKESATTLKDNSLDWKDVSKSVEDKARKWYLGKIK